MMKWCNDVMIQCNKKTLNKQYSTLSKQINESPNKQFINLTNDVMLK